MIRQDDYDKLRNLLIGYELKKHNQTLTWDNIQQAIALFTSDEQGAYVSAVVSGSDSANQLLQMKISATIQTAATETVDSYMTSGSFPIDYIASILL